MKTPREVLLSRHRAAEPKLDAIRQEALAALASSTAAGAVASARGEGGGMGALFGKVWQELIWPSRRAWAGLAALWIALLAMNLSMKAMSPAVPRAHSVPARELARAVQERQRWLAELLPATEPPPVQAPRPSARPRSERATPFKAA